MSPPFPLVDVGGPPFERGFQFGRACGDMIDRYPSVLQKALRRDALLRDPTSCTGDLSREELERRALRFAPTFEEFAPDQLEEIRGVAAGAEVSFATALLVNVRGEVGVFDKRAEALSGCTAFAAAASATADGGVLVAQNQDQGRIARDLVVVLRVEPERGPRMLMATFGGLLGYGGINSAGVGMMQNQLANSTWRFGMPHYPLKRALLEQESLSGCLEVFGRARLGSCANYVLVDSRNVLDVEATPDGFAVLQGEGGCLAHANHFVDPDLAKDEQLLAALPDSAERNLRLNALLAERRGRIALDDAKAWLSDHDGFPKSLCRHATSNDPTEISTMYSVICEADKGLMHVAAGNPCENGFYTYSLN
jgi:isopenicillin-N N-acyltransferase-like protein